MNNIHLIGTLIELNYEDIHKLRDINNKTSLIIKK